MTRAASGAEVDPSVATGTRNELAGGLQSLAQLARMLSGITTVERLIEVAAEQVCAGLEAASVSLSRLEPGTGTLRTLINVGELGPSEERWPNNETYSLENFLKLRGIVAELQMWTASVDDRDADVSEVRLLQQLGKAAAVGAPLIVNNTLWGELYITYAHGQAAFAHQDHAYLEVYLAILESALTNVTQIQSLERLAFHDPMTGLANRRALDDAAERGFALLTAGNLLRVNVVAIDLNGLKLVNDSAGHAEGDRLIMSAAAIIQTHFNGLSGSLTARVGGDEFVVLAPSHATNLVANAAGEACSTIAALPLGDGASCGIAAAGSTYMDRTVGELFRRADTAQYESKRTGLPVVIDAPTGSPHIYRGDASVVWTAPLAWPQPGLAS